MRMRDEESTLNTQRDDRHLDKKEFKQASKRKTQAIGVVAGAKGVLPEIRRRAEGGRGVGCFSPSI